MIGRAAASRPTTSRWCWPGLPPHRREIPAARPRREAASAQGAGAGEDAVEHGGGERAGEGVLLAGVVAGEEVVASDLGFGAVGEGVLGGAGSEDPEHLLVGQLSEAEQDAGADELGELPRKEIAAVLELDRQRTVAGRGAAGRSGEIGAVQAQAVAALAAFGLRGVAGAVQRGKEEIAAAVASEHAAGAVRAMGGGGKADQDQGRARVAEAGDGTAPVIFLRERRPLVLGNLRAVVTKPGAAAAGRNFGIQD